MKPTKLMKVFVQVPGIRFYEECGRPVSLIDQPDQYIGHPMSLYRQNDYIGTATGNVISRPDGSIALMEVQVSYYHWIMRPLAKGYFYSVPVETDIKLWVKPTEVFAKPQMSYVGSLIANMQRMAYAIENFVEFQRLLFKKDKYLRKWGY